jgi:hypothetical protein
MNDELAGVDVGNVEKAEPFDLFGGAAIERKRARQRELAVVFSGPPPAPEDGGDLDTLADAVAERMLERLAGEDAPEPTDPLTGAALDKLARKQAFTDLLRGRQARPRDEQRRFGSFDGGARQAPARPQTHEAWLYDRLV